MTVPRQTGLQVERWRNYYHLTLDGRELLLESLETSQSLAIHPSNKSFVLGTDWWLRAYDLDAHGAALWKRSVSSVV